MTKFLFKKVLIFSIMIALVSFIIDGRRLEVPLGIFIGSFISIYKIRLSSIFLTYLIHDKKKTFIKSIFLSYFSQALTLVILIVAVVINERLFYGVAAGLISTAIVICINGFTEKIGITHNNWQDLFRDE